MVQEHKPERIVQELVPGKEITIAHLIASPDITLYEKLGLDPRVEVQQVRYRCADHQPCGDCDHCRGYCYQSGRH